MEGLDPDYVAATVGSTPPLALSVLTGITPQKPYVTADPGFELGMMTASNNGARVVKVPLTKTYAHDVKAMLAAAPDGGVFYICNPNNPTGTLTPHADIEYLVANKPKDSIVVIDEAYIHFAEMPSSLDLAKSRNDVIVLRTFSKVYGLAGIRCGFIVAHPDLKDKVLQRGGYNFMPVTAVVAATTSLKDSALVPERRRINAAVRQQTFQWLDRNGFSYIPSESNCFMVDVKRPGQELRDAMAKENVFVGRVWPIMPTWVRVTVGTQEEMARFQTAFQKVMHA
jgi:histidinol-phosphate/aromatic aminotransferase/cobyric acid decarboxylase-like protein